MGKGTLFISTADAEAYNKGRKTPGLLGLLAGALGHENKVDALGDVNELLGLAIRTIKDRDAIVKDLAEISKLAGGGDNLTPLGMIQTIRERFAAPEIRQAEPRPSIRLPDRHEEQKAEAIMIELGKAFDVDATHVSAYPTILSLALDIVRKSARASSSDPTIDRLRKILEKTDAIRDDIAATIRISA